MHNILHISGHPLAGLDGDEAEKVEFTSGLGWFAWLRQNEPAGFERAACIRV